MNLTDYTPTVTVENQAESIVTPVTVPINTSSVWTSHCRPMAASWLGVTLCTREFFYGHIPRVAMFPFADVTVSSKRWTRSRVVLCSTILAVKLLQMARCFASSGRWQGWFVSWFYRVNGYLLRCLHFLWLFGATFCRSAKTRRFLKGKIRRFTKQSLFKTSVTYTKYNSISNQANSHDFARAFNSVIN